MAGFLSVVYGSLFLFLLSVLKLWLLSRWLLPRLISFVVRRRVSRPSPSERPNRRVSNLPSRVIQRLDSAFTPSPRLPRVSNQSRQVRRSGERGVDITVGAVGFLHVRDVVVRFHDGPIERVVVGDLLYTGQLLTLLAWLFEFVGKRARGVRLRDAIDDETSRATTAARDEPFDGTGAQSSPVAPSAGAFIARSRSLARQSSSNPASSFDPPPGSTDNPGRPSRASAEGARDRFGTAGASGTIMNLNVPVLAAGLRVKLRSPRGDLETRRDERGFGDEDEDDADDERRSSKGGGDEGKRTRRAPPLAWSTWQLLKNAATFVKITVTDVAVDASDLNTASSLKSSSLAGVHTAARVPK